MRERGPAGQAAAPGTGPVITIRELAGGLLAAVILAILAGLLIH